MKQRTLRSKASSLLLSLAMVVASLPQFSTSVLAADSTNELPTVEQFATVDELKKFNTDDTNDGTKNPAKVYFGDNNQQWWIAGSQQEHGLTLFAASPLAIGVQFNSTTNDGTYEGKTVFSNHYGASDIKNTVKDLESSYFTSTEQDLMNDTTIYTNDTKDDSIYSTTDKLYLAYGDYSDRHIIVGTNSQDSLNDGLRVDMSYWGMGKNDYYFWLRAPRMNTDVDALAALPDTSVFSTYVDSDSALVPAFELNLSSVLFASAALSATNVKADGTLEVKTVNDKDVKGAFTLRYDASKNNVNLGSALVSYDKSNVTLTDIPTDKAIYLVAQNKDGAKAKQIANETEISASTMGLDSFANCKVWLETTDASNRMIYAILATEVPDYAVAIVGNDYYSNVEDAINASSEETPAVLLRDVTDSGNGYFEPKDGAVLNTNGYTLSFNNEKANIILNPNSNFTINGSGNMNKPDIIIGKIAINPTSEIDFNKGFYLNDVYIKKSKEWFDTLLTNNGHMVFTNCKVDAYPTYGDMTKKENSVFVSGITEFYGNNTIIGDIELWQNGRLTNNGKLELIDGVIKGYITEPEMLVGCVGDPLSTVTLPENWEWVNPDEIINPIVNHERYFEAKAKYYIQDDYDYSHYDGFNEDGNYVVENVHIELIKKNEWIDEPSIESWTYGEKANTPDGQPLHGSVEFSYKLENGDEYSTEVPTEPGNYLMRAFVDKQEINHEIYKEMEVIIPFTIHKITPIITLPSDIVAFEGDKLADINLPNGFTWKDGNQIVNYSGEYDAIYTPEDTDHYKTIEVKIDVFMYDKPILNETPNIEANNISLTVGDKFDALKDVVVSDADGDKVTLEVIKNTVDTNKVGTYEVTYKAMDSKGASITKTIVVKVIEAVEEKEKLEDIINSTTSKYDKNDYTEESYQAYLDALEKVEEVLHDENATKQDIQEALEHLNDAIARLENKENEIPAVDKSELEQSLEEYKDLDSDGYTKKSYEAYFEAYKKAQAVLHDEHATSEEVAKALAQLNKAYAALEKQDREESDSNDYESKMIMS